MIADVGDAEQDPTRRNRRLVMLSDGVFLAAAADEEGRPMTPRDSSAPAEQQRAAGSARSWGWSFRVFGALRRAAGHDCARRHRPLGFGDSGSGAVDRRGARAFGSGSCRSCLVLLVYPVTGELSESAVPLRADWRWLLFGIFAFHGVCRGARLGRPATFPHDRRRRPLKPGTKRNNNRKGDERWSLRSDWA